MSVLEVNSPFTATATGATASLSHGYCLRIDCLESWLCRVAVIPDNSAALLNTWMIAPAEHEWSWQGRERLSTDGYSCPPVSAGDTQLKCSGFAIDLQPGPMALTISRCNGTELQPLLSDRPQAAYRLIPRQRTFQHAQQRPLDDLHLGLGDKTGALDRTGRRFRCLQLDALGYNAETSDPLYKHVPWVIVGNNERGYCGVFYDTFCETSFDLGAEHSNYHPHYRTVETSDTALVYYVVDGPDLASVVQRFQTLVGKPHLQPRWAIGFAHTSMHLADANNAQQKMLDFVDECKHRQVPISAIHSGSGYTTRDDGRRYVFTWNTKKFPDRRAFFTALDEAGLRTCANIKPVLLCEHPLFEEVAQFGGFIKDENGQPAIEQFWGGAGASLDFTNEKTISWWQKGVVEQVLGAGFTATWNDNNECEIWDEGATVSGFGAAVCAMDVRPVHALLMVRASYEATLQHNADARPYTISRAGPVGIARYAQTWSGDNRTSWHTLHWNMANGLSMSLSGFPFVGHDIGGFDGPKPDAELLCRWVEMMTLHPRAVMNSWKPQEVNPATLPWMHEESAQLITQLLNLRYRFLPLIYHLCWESHTTGSAVIAPPMMYFKDDACVGMFDQFMLGSNVLVAPVTQPEQQTRSVYLPEVSGGWFVYDDAEPGEPISGGQVIETEAPLGKLPIFIRAGSVLPLATQWSLSSPHDASSVELLAFIGEQEGSREQSVFFDDGCSWRYQKREASLLNIQVDWNSDTVSITASEAWSGYARPALTAKVVGLGNRQLEISLPG